MVKFLQFLPFLLEISASFGHIFSLDRISAIFGNFAPKFRGRNFQNFRRPKKWNFVQFTKFRPSWQYCFAEFSKQSWVRRWVWAEIWQVVIFKFSTKIAQWHRLQRPHSVKIRASGPISAGPSLGPQQNHNQISANKPYDPIALCRKFENNH